MRTAQLEKNGKKAKANGARHEVELGLTSPQALLSPPRTQRSSIQWPTGQQMQNVSEHLADISREGRRCELAGDYFKSGDLAYQLQEIIRATGELLKKSQRTRT
jgi:hypothetical protein